MIAAILSFLAAVVPLLATAYVQMKKEQSDANRKLGQVEADELDRGMAAADELPR